MTALTYQRYLTLVGLGINYKSVVMAWLTRLQQNTSLENIDDSNITEQGRDVVLALNHNQWEILVQHLESGNQPESLHSAVVSSDNPNKLPRFIKGNSYNREDERLKNASSRTARITASASNIDFEKSRRRAK